jgi:hypothetical protein
MELEYRTPSARSLNSLLHELQSTILSCILHQYTIKLSSYNDFNNLELHTWEENTL